MTKTIEIFSVCQGTSEIGVCLNGFMKHTGLMVRQEKDGTKVWNRKSGKTVFDPKKHYTLSNDKGRQELADDLEAIGLLGKSYYVWKAVQNAEPFNTGDDSVDREAMACYADCFDLGEFLTDADAIEAAEEIQTEHDMEASKVFEEAGFDDDLGGAGACYTAHLFREEEDEDVQVEI